MKEWCRAEDVDSQHVLQWFVSRPPVELSTGIAFRALKWQFVELL